MESSSTANEQLVEGRILGENDDDIDEGMDDSGKNANASTSTNNGSKANAADKIATTTNSEYGADFAIVSGIVTITQQKMKPSIDHALSCIMRFGGKFSLYNGGN